MFRQLAKGFAACVPGVYRAFSRAKTGGTCSASYCYSVWLRHLVRAHLAGLSTCPETVAELGPGDSIGIGLAALVTGAARYYALDIVEFANASTNVAVFDEIVEMVRCRAEIPGDDEWPGIVPRLESYAFPSDILDDNRLTYALRQSRLDSIRSSILAGAGDGFVQYQVPWNSGTVIRPHSVDMILTQAVLEHVDDLAWTYECLHRWLKRDGFMSNTIDFGSHGTANDWDGHWKYSDLTWKIIRGRRPYLINRKPFSTHERMLEGAGFVVHACERHWEQSTMNPARAPSAARSMSPDDLATSRAFMQATPKQHPAQISQTRTGQLHQGHMIP